MRSLIFPSAASVSLTPGISGTNYFRGCLYLPGNAKTSGSILNQYLIQLLEHRICFHLNSWKEATRNQTRFCICRKARLIDSNERLWYFANWRISSEYLMVSLSCKNLELGLVLPEVNGKTLIVFSLLGMTSGARGLILQSKQSQALQQLLLLSRKVGQDWKVREKNRLVAQCKWDKNEEAISLNLSVQFCNTEETTEMLMCF